MDLLLRPAFISEDATIGFAIDEMVSLRAGCMFTLGANGDVAGIFTVCVIRIRSWADKPEASASFLNQLRTIAFVFPG